MIRLLRPIRKQDCRERTIGAPTGRVYFSCRRFLRMAGLMLPQTCLRSMLLPFRLLSRS